MRDVTLRLNRGARNNANQIDDNKSHKSMNYLQSFLVSLLRSLDSTPFTLKAVTARDPHQHKQSSGICSPNSYLLDPIYLLFFAYIHPSKLLMLKSWKGLVAGWSARGLDKSEEGCCSGGVGAVEPNLLKSSSASPVQRGVSALDPLVHGLFSALHFVSSGYRIE